LAGVKGVIDVCEALKSGAAFHTQQSHNKKSHNKQSHSQKSHNKCSKDTPRPAHCVHTTVFSLRDKSSNNQQVTSSAAITTRQAQCVHSTLSSLRATSTNQQDTACSGSHSMLSNLNPPRTALAQQTHTMTIKALHAQLPVSLFSERVEPTPWPKPTPQR
jgi:hypothetical protein